MKKILLFLFFVAFTTFCFSQNATDSINQNTISSIDEVFPFSKTDIMPEYPGGEEARMLFLNKNLKYPSSARNKSITGTVYASFIVEKDGSITNVKILRSIDPDCDAEVIRIINLFPKWIPGKVKGEVVRVSLNMPFKFAMP